MERLKAAFPYLAAFMMGLVAAVPFFAYEGRFILEPDLPTATISYYHNTIRDWSWLKLPPPDANVYFDGHMVLYGFAAHLYEVVRSFFAPAIPIDDVSAITVGFVNGFAHALAALVVFATVRLLVGQTFIALLVAALFAFAPQIVDIDLVRADRLMILPLIVLIHISVVITRLEAGWREGLWLGAALALMATVKVTGFLFGVFPATAMLAIIVLRKGDPRVWPSIRAVIYGALITGVPLLCGLMIRFLLYPERFIAYIVAGYESQKGPWAAFYPFDPLFFYNVDLFMGYGRVFLLLVALSAIAVAVHAVIKRTPTAVWLVGNLLLFSVAGMIAFKYERGGYHLVPLYLYTLAAGLALLRDFVAVRLPGQGRLAGALACVLLLLIPLGTVAVAFGKSAEVGMRRPESITRTRLDSRTWIAEHFAPGDRICLIAGSEWASPQIGGFGFHVTTQVFDFPYWDAQGMAQYLPPRPDQVRAACDGIVFGNLHKGLYTGYYRAHGQAEKAEAWETLFKTLEIAYPPQVFEADTPAYYISRVEVYDLRYKPLAHFDAFGWDTQPSRLAALSAVLSKDGFQFGETVKPVMAERFSGALDSLVRYGGDHLLVAGWAIDTLRQEPAAAVMVVIGEKVMWFDGTATVRRADVAAHFKKPGFVAAGYATCLRYATPATDAVRIFAVGQDGAVGEVNPTGGAAIQEVADPTAKPRACRSAE